MTAKSGSSIGSLASGRFMLSVATVLACSLGAASAITTLNVTGTPVPDEDDIALLRNDPMAAGAGGINFYSDNYPVGSTFRTGVNAGGYALDSLAVFVRDPGTAAIGDIYTLTISTLNENGTAVSGTVFTASLALTSVPGFGQYLTFLTTDSVMLDANTNYVYTMRANQNYVGFGYTNVDPDDGEDYYPAGNVLRVFTDNNGLIQYGTAGYDATFSIGLTAAVVPEPASVGILALGGGLLLRRRRG